MHFRHAGTYLSSDEHARAVTPLVEEVVEMVGWLVGWSKNKVRDFLSSSTAYGRFS
jgi:hypothetical protein